MTIVRKFNLYLNDGKAITPVINVSQYDQGEEWLFTLFEENGNKYIPTSAAVAGVKSDGRAIVIAAAVNSAGQVVVTETEQMTAAPGKAVYELMLDGNTHGTANFIVFAEPKPTDGAVLSDSDLSLIQDAIDNTRPEVIAEAVDEWLDDHPEATTTVQDGSITEAKLASDVTDILGALDTELEDIRVDQFGGSYPSAGEAVRSQFADITEVTRNLFSKTNYFNGYMSGASQPIKRHATQVNCTVWIKCEPETTYTVSRRSGGGRFRAADFSTVGVPTTGDYPDHYEEWQNSALSGTFTTGASATYLCVWVWAEVYASCTQQEMIDSVQIEEGSTATAYVPHTSAVDDVARADIQTLGSTKFERFGALTDGSDLNDLYGINGYYTTATGSNYVNQPMSGGRRTLLIFQTGGATQYTVQMMFDAESGRIFTRAYVSNTWQAWKENSASVIEKDLLGSFTGRYAFSHGGCYSVDAYQDSPKAFKDAREMGIVFQDLDVVFTSDGVPVVCHNPYAHDSDGNGFWIKDKTLSQIKEMTFGDSDYTFTMQTMEECSNMLKNIGCYPCIDVHGSTYNPAGSVEAFPTYLKKRHIKPVYLTTSDVTTFNKLVSNGGTDFPLGIVITSAQDAEFADKIDLIVDTVVQNSMDHGWLFVPCWSKTTFDSLMEDYLEELGEANIKIVKYGLNATSQFNNNVIATEIDGVCSNVFNVNYEMYTRSR